MTRKQFQKLADLLNRYEKSHPDFDLLVEMVMDFCEEENPRFDREKFINAVNKEN